MADRKNYLIACKYHSKYQAERRSFLSNPVVIKYLFSKPLINKQECRLTDHKMIYCGSTESEKVEMILMAMVKFSEDYQLIISKDVKNKVEYPMDNKFRTKYHSMISDLLFQKRIDYSFNFDFELTGQRLSADDKEPYSFQMDINVDFICCMRLNTIDDFTKQIIFFAIDHGRTKKNIFEKIYQLSQFNIHYLVITTPDHISEKIDRFISKIRSKNNDKLITPKTTTGLWYSRQKSFGEFQRMYKVNRSNYFKFYKNNNAQDPDVLGGEGRESGSGTDQSYDIDNRALKKILSKKYFFTKV